MSALLAAVDRWGPSKLASAGGAGVLILVAAAFGLAAVHGIAEKKVYVGTLAVLVLAAAILAQGWFEPAGRERR